MQREYLSRVHNDIPPPLYEPLARLWLIMGFGISKAVPTSLMGNSHLPV